MGSSKQVTIMDELDERVKQMQSDFLMALSLREEEERSANDNELAKQRSANDFELAKQLQAEEERIFNKK